MPRWVNILIQAIAMLGQVSNQFFDAIPQRWKMPVMIGLALGQGLVAILANSYNPDGTRAVTAYVPPGAIAKILPNAVTKVGIVLACVLVSGCATLQDDVDAIHARLQVVVQADLDAALASASRPQRDGTPIDPDGVRCFSALKVLAGAEARQLPDIKGVLSTIEAARSIRLSMESTKDSTIGAINTACAAWWMSVKGQAVKLALDVMKAAK
jgi:hypothetical protein